MRTSRNRPKICAPSFSRAGPVRRAKLHFNDYRFRISANTMPKRFYRWLLTTALVSGSLFGAFTAFSSVDQGIGWGILGFIAVSGIYGFSYCVSTSSRENDGGSSPNNDAWSSGGDIR